MTRVLRVISVVCSSENDSRTKGLPNLGTPLEWSFRVHKRKVGRLVAGRVTIWNSRLYLKTCSCSFSD